MNVSGLNLSEVLLYTNTFIIYLEYYTQRSVNNFSSSLTYLKYTVELESATLRLFLFIFTLKNAILVKKQTNFINFVIVKIFKFSFSKMQELRRFMLKSFGIS